MLYPTLMDIGYSTALQNNYGELEVVWTYDRTIPCRVASNTNYKDQNVFPEQRMRILDQINAQVTEDVRIDSFGEMHALTDVLITNIRSSCGESAFTETAGDRAGDSTMYEVMGYSPHIDPFGKVDYIKIVLNRADEQVAT